MASTASPPPNSNLRCSSSLLCFSLYAPPSFPKFVSSPPKYNLTAFILPYPSCIIEDVVIDNYAQLFPYCHHKHLLCFFHQCTFTDKLCTTFLTFSFPPMTLFLVIVPSPYNPTSRFSSRSSKPFASIFPQPCCLPSYKYHVRSRIKK